MKRKDIPQTIQWLKNWEKLSPQLEELRRIELKKISTSQALLNLADAFESCRLHYTPKPSSGLVLQQMWFKKQLHG